ncbi:MAG: hypothetical protein WD604_15690 [Balneolaceae bacterium]
MKKFAVTEFPQPEIVQLRHPVLLCHGYGAMINLVRPAPLHETCMRLRSHGVISFAPNVVPYSTISVRAEQWSERIHQLQKQYGFKKLNIVAHSMAGLDMRCAITNMDMAGSVASLTTVATPHRGASLAEIVLTAPGTVREKLGELFDWFGENMFPGQKSNSVGAVEQLTRKYVTEEFNPATPDMEDILYFSFSAASGKGTNEPLNPIYRFQNQLIYQHEGLNDSFVSVESAKWGNHLGTAPISHLEQIEFQVGKERKEKIGKFWFDVIRNLEEKGL